MPSLGISARRVGAEWRCLRQPVPPLPHSRTAYPGQVPSTGPTAVDVDPGTWQTWCLPGFSTVGLLFPPFRTALGEEVTMRDQTLGLGSSAPSPGGRSTHINYWEFFCMGGLSLLPLLFIYISTMLDFLAQLVPYLVIRSALGWSLCSLSIIVGFAVCFEHFLTFWHYEVLQARPGYFLLQP